ncbi:MAG: molybdopterin-dependent oxidoreductase [Pseudomonadota bacterium]
MTNRKEIKTLCGMCPWACGIIVSVENEKAVKIEGDPDHPWNHGKLCPKAAGIIDYVYSPDRIKYPMKKVNGEFQRISWDEALDIMATELNKIKENYGAKSWAVLEGMSFVCQGFTSMTLLQRFCDAYGSPNFITPESMCYLSRITANMLTLGKFPAADPENSKCIILWGHNPSESNFITAEQIMNAKKKGAKLIVIDPRKTSFAKKADIHAQIRPGTDCALALSMLNVIISDHLYDTQFVEKWTTGFDEFAEHIKAYPPEKIEKITLVPEKIIRSMAHLYAANKPACILEGINTLQQVPTGFQSQRAILILQSITANIDIAGGLLAVDLGGPEIPSVANCSPLRLADTPKEPPMGQEQFPILVQGGWTAQGMLLPDMILTGKPYPIKGLAVVGSNPLLTWPNTNKMRSALEKLDFLAVILTTMNETAQLADLILPEASFLERTEIWEILSISFAKPFINLRNKAIGFYESMPNPEIWIKLAKRMGYEKYFPWKDMNELLEYSYGPTGLDLKTLFGKTNCIPFGEIKYKQYEKEGFKTPSGKIEIFSSVMKQLGLESLPVYNEPTESPFGSPGLAKEYPVILTTGSRTLQYTHSSFREIEKFKKKMPEPNGEIHPETAKLYGINDGELMIVETKRGKIEIKAKTTEDILPNTLSIPHGWAKHNVNALTDEKSVDPVTGYPALKALLCKISPKKE